MANTISNTPLVVTHPQSNPTKKSILKSFCYCQINVLPNPAVVRPGAVTALVRFTEGCMFWAILGRFPEKKKEKKEFSIKFDERTNGLGCRSKA